MINDEAIREFLRRAGQDTSTDAMTVLENLSLLTTHGEICNGAVLLFAANTQRFFPESLVRCARFAGTTSVTFIDQVTITGTALHQLDEALRFVTRNTRQSLRITGKAEHETIPEYPLDAVREAIVNAICHRNYTETGNIQVRIYDDRFEVWNPGTLPPGLTFEALYSEHATRPRNPRFANALHHANVMEKWGTGTLRMIQACKDRNLPLPEFTSETGNFIARMRQQVSINALPHYHDLNQRQQEVLRYVRETGHVTIKDYMKQYDISRRQAHRDLDEMIQHDFFIRVGGGRSSYYELVSLLKKPNIIWD